MQEPWAAHANYFGNITIIDWHPRFRLFTYVLIRQQILGSWLPAGMVRIREVP